jgi:DNA-binding transcriptional LysR family regulator
VIVQEHTTDGLLKSCTQRELDLAILALPVPVKYLEVEVLFEEELLLVLPRDHPLVNKETSWLLQAFRERLRLWKTPQPAAESS